LGGFFFGGDLLEREVPRESSKGTLPKKGWKARGGPIQERGETLRVGNGERLVRKPSTRRNWKNTRGKELSEKELQQRPRKRGLKEKDISNNERELLLYRTDILAEGLEYTEKSLRESRGGEKTRVGEVAQMRQTGRSLGGGNKNEKNREDKRAVGVSQRDLIVKKKKKKGGAK